MPNNNQWLTEILELLDDNLANVPSTATEIGWEKWGEEKQEYYKQAEKLILQKISEAIGEDEPDEVIEQYTEDDRVVQVTKSNPRNQLKAELRQKLGLPPLHQASLKELSTNKTKEQH